jgi:molecular chaperone DnaK (HSP70)
LISPEEVSKLVLMKLKQVAKRYLNQTIYKAFVTVPVYFNEDQRKATINAGSIAALKVNRIISEPTVAALAYGLDKKYDRYVIVCDLGGGTIDVSLMTMEEDYFQVLTTGSDTRLGGEDFDKNCVQTMIGSFNKAHNKNPSRDRVAHARLKQSCSVCDCSSGIDDVLRWC